MTTNTPRMRTPSNAQRGAESLLCPLVRSRRPLDRAPSPSEESQHEQQHDRPDERDKNGARETAERRRDAEGAEDPATDERADDADDDVADQTVPRPAHHKRCEDAGDEPDDNPGKKCHWNAPERVRLRRLPAKATRVPLIARAYPRM